MGPCRGLVCTMREGRSPLQAALKEGGKEMKREGEKGRKRGPSVSAGSIAETRKARENLTKNTLYSVYLSKA